MPRELTETEWRHVLRTYLSLRSTSERITRANEKVIELAATLQMLNLAGATESEAYRTEDGLTKRTKVFAQLDKEGPYDYRIPYVPALARKVWAEVKGDVSTYEGALAERLESEVRASFDELERTLHVPASAQSAIYVLQHEVSRRFVKVGVTNRDPSRRAKEYGDGGWRVFGSVFCKRGTAAKLEKSAHHELMKRGLWANPGIFDGHRKEIFVCTPIVAMQTVLEVGERLGVLSPE